MVEFFRTAPKFELRKKIKELIRYQVTSSRQTSHRVISCRGRVPKSVLKMQNSLLFYFFSLLLFDVFLTEVAVVVAKASRNQTFGNPYIPLV